MPGRATVPTLDRIRALCDLMGDPQLSAPVIHVTGTNGKGSTVAIVTELLGAAGLTVGAFTSPDLTVINERITRNSEPIGDAELIEVLGSLATLEPMLDGRPTRFDLLTAAAFRWFADVAVDVAVVEVGLGGRWDATNVVDPVVAVVTNVSEDHMEVLGPTLIDVAKEKAGIVKSGSLLVLGETDPELSGVFLQAAESVGAAGVWRRGTTRVEGEFACDANDVAVGGRLLDLRTPGGRYEQVLLGLHGAHQGDNAACALAAVEGFFASPLDDRLVRTALASVRVPGRLEIVARSPLVVLDGAHNVAGAKALALTIAGDFAVAGEKVAVVGLLAGRDPVAMLSALASAGVSRVVLCPAPSPRALAVADLGVAAGQIGLASDTADSVGEACELATRLAGDDGLVVVTGSLYVVGEARSIFVASPPRGDQNHVASLNGAMGIPEFDGRVPRR
jgi:dihydrofolate synthase/folylpolyglutamate synthase